MSQRRPGKTGKGRERHKDSRDGGDYKVRKHVKRRGVRA
jgi:hypothetical protein